MFLRENEFKSLKILGENFFRRVLGNRRAENNFSNKRIAEFKQEDALEPSEGYAIFDNMIDAWECRFDEWVNRPRWLRVKEYTRMMQEAHGFSEMI